MPADPPATRPRAARRLRDPVPGLLARGDLRVPGDGLVELAGVALRLARWFDAVFRRWARDLGGVEHEYPALIPIATLARAGYPQAFPQHLAVAAPCAPNARARVADRPDRIAAADLAEPSLALTPAVCYHAYPGWAGRRLPDSGAVVTSVGRCVRHEAGPLRALERLREFTMRELIFAGAREAVDALRSDLLGRARALAADLDLEATVEEAADPFFTEAARGRLLMQRLLGLKYELRMPLAGGGTTAVASFNLHLDFFGRAFGIADASGGAAHTGCVAFGLERLVLAFLTQHGLDADGWPPPAREAAGAER
jgi:seryl-tRNA synthetase